MTQKFDKLISNSAPVVPDSGASRRMTQALLHEKMRQQEQRQKKRNRRGMSLVASLVFLFVIGGQVTELGSDGFGLIESDQPSLDQTSTIYETEFRNTSFNAPKSWSEEKVQEFLQSVEADEGRVLQITGIEIAGKTLWTKRIEKNIDGELTISSEIADDPPSELSPFHLPFMKNKSKSAYQTANNTAPLRTEVINIEGVDIEFGVWEFNEEDTGKVTFYRVRF